MTLYYDSSKQNLKDTYDMISSKQILWNNRDELSFTVFIPTYKKEENIIFKFDDQYMRDDYFNLIMAWKTYKSANNMVVYILHLEPNLSCA